MNESAAKSFIPTEQLHSPKTFEVLQIPHIFEKHFYPYLQKNQNQIENAGKNLECLEQLVENQSSAKYLSPWFKEIVSQVRDYYNFYQNELPLYSQAKPASDLIAKKIPQLRSINPNWGHDQKGIEIALENNFYRTSGKKICLSESHLSTLFTLNAVEQTKTNRNAQIGVIVFDNHTDIYNNFRLPTKGNLFDHLGIHQTIAAATFIGGINQEEMIDDENETMINYQSHTIFRQIPIEDIKPNNQTDRKYLTDQLINLVKKYWEDGITNLVFSIDLDVLRVKKMVTLLWNLLP